MLPIHIEETLWDARKKHFVSVIEPHKSPSVDSDADEAYVLNPQYKPGSVPSVLLEESVGSASSVSLLSLEEAVACFDPSGVCVRIFESISVAATELHLTQALITTLIMQAHPSPPQSDSQEAQHLGTTSAPPPLQAGEAGGDRPGLRFDWAVNLSAHDKQSAEDLAMSAAEIHRKYVRVSGEGGGRGHEQLGSSKRLASRQRRHHQHVKRRRGSGLRDEVKPSRRGSDYVYMSGGGGAEGGGTVAKRKREDPCGVSEGGGEGGLVVNGQGGGEGDHKKPRRPSKPPPFASPAGPTKSDENVIVCAPVVPVPEAVVLAAPSYIRSYAQVHWEDGLAAYCHRHEIKGEGEVLSLSLPPLSEGPPEHDEDTGARAVYVPRECTCLASAESCRNEETYLLRARLVAFPPGTVVQARVPTGSTQSLPPVEGLGVSSRGSRPRRSPRTRTALVCSLGQVEISEAAGGLEEARLVVFDGERVLRVPIQDVVLDNEDEFLTAWCEAATGEGGEGGEEGGEDGVYWCRDVCLSHVGNGGTCVGEGSVLSASQQLIWGDMNSTSGEAWGGGLGDGVSCMGESEVASVLHAYAYTDSSSREGSVDFKRDCARQLSVAAQGISLMMSSRESKSGQEWSAGLVTHFLSLLDRYEGDLHAVRRAMSSCLPPADRMHRLSGGMSMRLVWLMHVMVESAPGQGREAKLKVWEYADRLKAARGLLPYLPHDKVQDDVYEWIQRGGGDHVVHIIQ